MRTKLQELDLRWSRAMFGRWGQKNAHQTVAKNAKPQAFREEWNRFHCRAAWLLSICATLLLCGFASGVSKRIGTARKASVVLPL